MDPQNSAVIFPRGNQDRSESIEVELTLGQTLNEGSGADVIHTRNVNTHEAK